VRRDHVASGRPWHAGEPCGCARVCYPPFTSRSPCRCRSWLPLVQQVAVFEWGNGSDAWRSGVDRLPRPLEYIKKCGRWAIQGPLLQGVGPGVGPARRLRTSSDLGVRCVVRAAPPLRKAGPRFSPSPGPIPTAKCALSLWLRLAATLSFLRCCHSPANAWGLSCGCVRHRATESPRFTRSLGRSVAFFFHHAACPVADVDARLWPGRFSNPRVLYDAIVDYPPVAAVPEPFLSGNRDPLTPVVTPQWSQNRKGMPPERSRDRPTFHHEEIRRNRQSIQGCFHQCSIGSDWGVFA